MTSNQGIVDSMDGNQLQVVCSVINIYVCTITYLCPNPDVVELGWVSKRGP